jgi:hypothetical protein
MEAASMTARVRLRRGRPDAPPGAAPLADGSPAVPAAFARRATGFAGASSGAPASGARCVLSGPPCELVPFTPLGD